MEWDGRERRAGNQEMHDNFLALSTRIETMLNVVKFCVILGTPALIGYIVFEHQAIERIEGGLVEVRNLVASINERGSKHLLERSQRDHSTSGCHFLQTRRVQ